MKWGRQRRWPADSQEGRGKTRQWSDARKRQQIHLGLEGEKHQQGRSNQGYIHEKPEENSGKQGGKRLHNG